jgi:hypothetical protein
VAVAVAEPGLAAVLAPTPDVVAVAVAVPGAWGSDTYEPQAVPETSATAVEPLFTYLLADPQFIPPASFHCEATPVRNIAGSLPVAIDP